MITSDEILPGEEADGGVQMTNLGRKKMSGVVWCGETKQLLIVYITITYTFRYSRHSWSRGLGFYQGIKNNNK